MSGSKLVWSDEEGDLRGNKGSKKTESSVDEGRLELHIRRLTSGKGRTAIELTGLPNNKKWCQQLAKELKKKLGVGGAYKQAKTGAYIEVHGEKIEDIMKFLDSKSLKWKKIGG